MIDKLCSECGEGYKGLPNSVYCSRKCMYVANSRRFAGTGNPFAGRVHSPEARQKIAKAREGRAIPCSEATRLKHSLRMKEFANRPEVRAKRSELGKQRGVPEKTREALVEYFKKKREREAWRKSRTVFLEVLQRDARTCRICGRQTDRPYILIVHHIDPNGPYSLENLVTICRSCHNKVHLAQYYGYDVKLYSQMMLAGMHPQGWALRFAQCRECGTTKVKHVGNGLCNNCHQRQYRQRKGTT